jgi:hypothetical protein
MIALLCFFLTLFASPFKSKSRLEAENPALRHQLIVLQSRVSGRVQLTNGDGHAVSMVSIDPQGHHDHPAGDPCALAPGRAQKTARTVGAMSQFGDLLLGFTKELRF